ncbi:MAG: alpha-glucosidase/alpha-galactosidase [Acidimicrobiaceae bacterium]|nr:alpha-glucosidase/alpha-galactosidase [Acidimicrobiaceae bacterium]|tara:strand:+ start:1209 stop:2546 length:1338 start_codon:yes stop_codon:yes gene_type:complete
MPKIVFVGAGSTVFAQNLLTDILSLPDLSHSEIMLYDIEDDRLRTTALVANSIQAQLGTKAVISSSLDLREALFAADYVITMFQIGGYKPSTVIDFEIPKRYGLRQTIGDTLGIGGIMRGIRTIPVMLQVVEEMEVLCPDALLLNYVNPMAMLCWAIAESSNIQTIGLCHSVQHTATQLARDLEILETDLNYVAAGINHMSFFLKLEKVAEQENIDLYPQLRERAKGQIPSRRVSKSVALSDAVRYEVFRRTGFFVTESSEHFAEYVPWFIKSGREDLLKEFAIPLDEYPRRCEEQIAEWVSLRDKLENPDTKFVPQKSNEYGAGIIHSMETGQERTFNGNVMNMEFITNLPQEACVEVPCVVNGSGVHPQKIGKLPPHIAAIIQTNINVQSLTVRAVLEKSKDHIYHAAMLDPRTSAELSLEQIWSLVDEMIEAHGEMIPPDLR